MFILRLVVLKTPPLSESRQSNSQVNILKQRYHMLDPVTYYILLVPASIPVIFTFYYTAWLGWQLFVNN